MELNNIGLVSRLVNSDKDDAVFLVGHTKKINKELGNISKSFLRIGFLLYEVYSKKLYKLVDYDNITQYALMEFNFKKTQTFNFINIVERFSERNEDGAVKYLTLKEDFKEYNFTQLCELLPVEDKYLCKFNPSMSCKNIRDLKKQLKEKNLVSEEKSVQSTGTNILDENDIRTILSFLNTINTYDQEQSDELFKVKMKLRSCLPH